MRAFQAVAVPLILIAGIAGALVLRPLEADATQAAAERSFEAASVKRREPGIQPPAVRMLVTPGRISFQAVMLKDCIRWAYGLAEYQITGGPAWIERTRWDIEAKAEGPASDTELRQMFRALLAERFGFRMTRGTSETRAYTLSAAKPGPNLRPAADDAPRTDDWRMSPLFQRTRPGPGTTVIRELTSRRVSMRYLAEYLTRQLRIPVLDRTSLEGDFDIRVEWPADAATARDPASGRGAPPAPAGADMFGTAGIDALRDQLGLLLTSTRAPIDVLVIEAVKEASDN